MAKLNPHLRIKHRFMVHVDLEVSTGGNLVDHAFQDFLLFYGIQVKFWRNSLRFFLGWSLAHLTVMIDRLTASLINVTGHHEGFFWLSAWIFNGETLELLSDCCGFHFTPSLSVHLDVEQLVAC
jgi:hypothetical protein